MTPSDILLVEDNYLVSETIELVLIEEGYNVVTASNAKELLDKLPTVRPQTIILDLVLPDGDGLSLIKVIRQYTDAPLIIISGRNHLIDKIVGLEMGADDYIGKPIHMKELAARVKAHTRRYRNSKDPAAAKDQINKNDATRIQFGSWILDRARLQIFAQSGAKGNLTVSEFHLVEALVLNSNRVLSREQLLDKARSNNYDITDRAIDVQILRIRKKMNDKDGKSVIQAVRGIGYILACETIVIS